MTTISKLKKSLEPTKKPEQKSSDTQQPLTLENLMQKSELLTK
uniref:Uncharacterized protein n=1 Tax=Myoviridae sp. ctBtT5 TaxID=2825048 RepID=A0A8S5PY64_9CAUD|nr:MAG TPA: hypothetical protein [Myoviridae sp. ctBtT5]